MFEVLIGVERIRVDRAVGFDVTSNLGFDVFFPAIGNHGGTNFSPRSSIPKAGVLSFVPVSVIQPSPLVCVHGASSAADESLVYFDFLTATTDFVQRFVAHCQPDSVKHEPRRFLGDAEGAANFV